MLKMPEITFEPPEQYHNGDQSNSQLRGTLVKPAAWFSTYVIPVYFGSNDASVKRKEGSDGGEHLDPFETCALSEASSDKEIRLARDRLQERYLWLAKRRKKMHYDSTLMNELERTRLDVILKQLEIEKSLQVCRFRRQEKRLRRSLELLEGYKEKLKNKLTERAQEIHRRNKYYQLRGDNPELLDHHREREHEDERILSEIRKAKQMATEKHVDGHVKYVNIEFRLPPLAEEQTKLWTNPIEDGQKYDRAKHYYGKQVGTTAVSESGESTRAKYRVSFLPDLEERDSDRKYIKFTKGFDGGDRMRSNKTSPLKSCLKKADSEVSLNKINLTTPSRYSVTSRHSDHTKDVLEEQRERNNQSKSKVSFPSVYNTTDAKDISRENWLRRVKDVKKRHAGTFVGGSLRGRKFHAMGVATISRSNNLAVSNKNGTTEKLPPLLGKTD